MFPLLELDEMEEIFAEFGLTTAEMFGQVFREEESYYAHSGHALQKTDFSESASGPKLTEDYKWEMFVPVQS